MAVDPHVKPELADRPRSGTPMPPAKPFRAVRPGEVVQSGQPRGARYGSPGPDLGFALALADGFRDRLELAAHEHAADALTAGCAVAMRRCSLSGRAPTSRDVEVGLALLGYLGGAPPELVAWRRRLADGAAHGHGDQRALADAFTEEALALSPTEARERLGRWRDLLGAAPAPA